MLGKIIFARRQHSHDAPEPFIVVGVTPQYGDGVTYTVVPEDDSASFETLDIFVSNGYRHVSCAFEVLGTLISREYVENKIKRINGLFVENVLQIEWTAETVATAIETIRALEKALVALDDPIDAEFKAEPTQQPVTTDEMDEIGRRVDAGFAEAFADPFANEYLAEAEGRRLLEAQLQSRSRRVTGGIPVIIIDMGTGFDPARFQQEAREILAKLGQGGR